MSWCIRNVFGTFSVPYGHLPIHEYTVTFSGRGSGSRVAEDMAILYSRGGRPRLIIHEYAVTFSGRGFGRVAEVAETQVL